ncbi:hypothetical protein SS50377_23560 [Spironucleus salmonicida]|uniref:Uncharacterized protein n=1 Tax=Spironucleus salmonicida TaxID=348837 RepID=V6LV75_9EUKA|nr:hypothetical protein SS50377_23560 [Spironucleus salmonicida]|eukprot:EST48542.1 Hypothetical protein SS50377_11153 [Spironucleus salmonicida]
MQLAPQFIVLSKHRPKTDNENIIFFNTNSKNQDLFEFLQSSLTNANTVSFQSANPQISTQLYLEFSEFLINHNIALQPNVSIYELENETAIDLLGDEENFESDYQDPHYRTVRLSSKRDTKLLFKLVRLLSQNFQDNQIAKITSDSFCRVLLVDDGLCKSYQIIAGPIQDVFGDASTRFKQFASPLLRVCTNIVVFVEDDLHELERLLQKLGSFRFKSRELSLHLSPQEIILTPLDTVLGEFEELISSENGSISSPAKLKYSHHFKSPQSARSQQMSPNPSNSTTQLTESLHSDTGLIPQQVHPSSPNQTDLPEVIIENFAYNSPPKSVQCQEFSVNDIQNCESLSNSALQYVNFQEPITMYDEFQKQQVLESAEKLKQLPIQQSKQLSEAQVQYNQSLKKLQEAERVRVDLESKLRHVEASASEYLLKIELQKINSKMRSRRIEILQNGKTEDIDELLSKEENVLVSMEDQYVESIFNTYSALKQHVDTANAGKSFSQISALMKDCRYAVEKRVNHEKQVFESQRKERQFVIQQYLVDLQQKHIKNELGSLDKLQQEQAGLQKQLDDLQQLDKQVSLKLRQESLRVQNKQKIMAELDMSIVQSQQLKMMLGRDGLNQEHQDQRMLEGAKRTLISLNNNAQCQLLTPDEARLRSDLEKIVETAAIDKINYQDAFQLLQKNTTQLEVALEQKLLKMLQQ